jgi:thiamine-phosphate pyrophosphorylase
MFDARASSRAFSLRYSGTGRPKIRNRCKQASVRPRRVKLPPDCDSIPAAMPRPKPAPDRPVPRLYLVTPRIEDAGTLADDLPVLLAAADIAAVLLRLPTGGESGLIKTVKALAPAIQKAGAAVILDGHADLVGRSGADGAHLVGLAAFEAALPALKPARIAGAGGLPTRHDAMVAAEAGADYVMFGGADAEGRPASFETVIERTGWWAEVFEVPCVAFAARLDEVGPLARAGADFVAVGDCIWTDPRGAKAAIEDAAAALFAAETAA